MGNCSHLWCSVEHACCFSRVPTTVFHLCLTGVLLLHLSVVALHASPKGLSLFTGKRTLQPLRSREIIETVRKILLALRWLGLRNSEKLHFSGLENGWGCSALFLPELCTAWTEDVTGPFYHKPLKFNCMVAGRCICYLVGNSWPRWKGGGLGEHLWIWSWVLPLTCGSSLLPLSVWYGPVWLSWPAWFACVCFLQAIRRLDCEPQDAAGHQPHTEQQ